MDVIKTSRDIRIFFDNAMKRNDVSAKLMAEDTGQTAQGIANNRHTVDTTAANAVKDAAYLRDYRFSNQLAAAYFEAIQMFDTEDWSPKFRDEPFATLDAIDDQRATVIELRRQVKTFMRDRPREKWTHDQCKKAELYSYERIKLISMELLFNGQFEDVSCQDMLKIVHEANKHNKLGGFKWLKQ